MASGLGLGSSASGQGEGEGKGEGEGEGEGEGKGEGEGYAVVKPTRRAYYSLLPSLSYLPTYYELLPGRLQMRRRRRRSLLTT